MPKYLAFARNLPQNPAAQLARLGVVYGCALALIAAGPHLPHWGL